MAEKVIDRRSSLQILKEICIHNGIALVTDLQSMLVMPVPDERSYTIPVLLLKKVLNAKPQNLAINLAEDNRGTIHYDDLKVTYSTKDVNDFPTLPQGKFKPVGVWPQDVFQILLKQVPYCSQDELKASLTGVYLTQAADGLLTICATNGHILRMKNGLEVAESKPLSGIIPTKPLHLLSRYTKGRTKIGLSDTHLSFSLPGSASLYVRLIDEQYPEVVSVIPEEFNGEVVLDRDKALAIIKAAKPFVDKTTYLSVLTISDGIGMLSIDNQEEQISWEAPLPITKQQGDEIRIGFDLGLFERALAGQQSPAVCWKYTSQNAASVFKEVGDQYDHEALTLLMPIRITEEEVNDDQKRDN
jgi:DNA polymerase-3 subunit beta